VSSGSVAEQSQKSRAAGVPPGEAVLFVLLPAWRLPARDDVYLENVAEEANVCTVVHLVIAEVSTFVEVRTVEA